MTAQEQAKAIAEALKGRKGEDVKIYDVRGKSALTDFFVVATGAVHSPDRFEQFKEWRRILTAKGNREIIVRR